MCSSSTCARQFSAFGAEGGALRALGRVSGLRALLALAVAAFTLAAPVCPALALGPETCCCASEEPQSPLQTLDLLPCDCADAAHDGQSGQSPATSVESGAHVLPPPRAQGVTLPSSERPRPLPAPRGEARPPPQLSHIRTVVLRR